MKDVYVKNWKKFPVSAQPSGECAKRLQLASGRLHKSDFYSLDDLYKRNVNVWPGDFPGRVMLAWHQYSQIFQQQDADLIRALELYQQNCNSLGYLGTVHENMLDEQQLSGHGWLLRAMAELYTTDPQERYRQIAQDVFEHLALPLTEHLADYPLNDGHRNASGAVDGSTDRRVGVWQLSTDVGAVFIFFAGLVHAAEVFALPAEKILKKFVELAGRVEFLKTRYQTHASLTLARALLRYSRVFKDKAEEDLAVKIYDIYRSNAMTANGANYNWFCRPEWTEPCAVVDSFMVAMELFRRSGKSDYLEDAHKIWFSAFFRQRPGGGFGTDSCACDNEDTLYVKLYEAVHCCNMRAAEGFYEALLRGMYCCGDTLFIALPIPGVFEFADGLTVELATVYPIGDVWTAKILAQGSSKVKNIRCYISGKGWMDCSGSCQTFELAKRFADDGKSFSLYRGPLMYGSNVAGEQQPVSSLYLLTEAQAREEKLKVIFKNNDF